MFLLDNGLNIFILVGSNVPVATLEAVFGELQSGNVAPFFDNTTNYVSVYRTFRQAFRTSTKFPTRASRCPKPVPSRMRRCTSSFRPPMRTNRLRRPFK